MITYICYYIQSETGDLNAEATMIGFGVNVAKLKEHAETAFGGKLEWEQSEIAKQYGGGFRYLAYVTDDEDEESFIGKYEIEPVKEIV